MRYWELVEIHYDSIESQAYIVDLVLTVFLIVLGEVGAAGRTSAG